MSCSVVSWSEATSEPPKVVRSPSVLYILTPQRRALFRHLNFQKWSNAGVFSPFWLRNVLRATTACTFSTSQPPKVARTCGVLYILTSCFAPQRRALFQHPNLQKWREHVVFCTFWLGNVLRATTACTFSTSEPPNVARTCGVLYILTWKCASRHDGVHFFDIAAAKSGPDLVCFVHFDLEMCFAPQRRALFRHRNFQKWSGAEVFCTFWLGNVLRATTACNFSSLIWPAGSAPAALASLLFDPPEPQIIGITQCFATFHLFAHLHLLSSYSFSSTLLSSNLSLLSASSLLCFSSVHIVGSLTSKLPSINGVSHTHTHMTYSFDLMCFLNIVVL